MNFLGKKAIAVMMMTVLLLGLPGCVSYEKAGKKLLRFLEEKYGEEFILEGIGGGYGTMNNNTLKAVVRPKRDPTMRVMAEITKDLKQVFDNYLAVVVARNNIPEVEAVAKEIWPDARVHLANDMGPYASTKHTDLGMTYQEFIQLYPMNTLLVDVYVDADNYINPDGTMDEEGEYEKYKTFMDRMVEKGYISAFVSIIYTNPVYYAKFDEAMKSEYGPTFYYDDFEKNNEIVLVTGNGFKITGKGTMYERKDEIDQTFEIWRERREQYARQKGGVK